MSDEERNELKQMLADLKKDNEEATRYRIELEKLLDMKEEAGATGSEFEERVNQFRELQNIHADLELKIAEIERMLED